MQKSRLERSVKITLIGLVTNAVLALGKMVAGVAGNSHALIADAVESLADLLSSLVVWRAVVVSNTPPDEDHPYGHGKAEAIASAVVASMLLGAAVWIFVTAVIDAFGINKQGPKAFTLYVLVAVVFIKEYLYRKVMSEANDLENTAITSDAWHHRADAITSLTAGLGIIVALVGGPKFVIADDIAAMIAAVFVGYNGYHLLRPALDELMDASPSSELHDRIRQVAGADTSVSDVEKCRLRKVGNRYFVDMHLRVSPLMTVAEAHIVAHRVKDRIREDYPSVQDVLVHIEPSHVVDHPKA